MNKFENEQRHIKQAILLFLLFVWLFRAWSGLLLVQLHDSPLLNVGSDNMFWLFYSLQFPNYIIKHQWLGLSCDLLWLGIAIGGLFYKLPKYSYGVLGFLLLNYSIIYNATSTHHEHTLVGVVFMSMLLIPTSSKNFTLLFAALRYYALFALSSAGLWKIYRESAFHANQMSEILKTQHLEYLTTYPESYYSNFISFLIEHPFCSNWLWYSGLVIELSFLIGFLTRRYDPILGILFLAFFIGDYLIMNLCFAEFCIFVLVFYPWNEIWKYYNAEFKLPPINQ